MVRGLYFPGGEEALTLALAVVCIVLAFIISHYGQDPDDALREALEDAARAARAAPAGGAAPSERNPNFLLKEGGWFAVNSEAARVANFEAAAELVESAFGCSGV